MTAVELITAAAFLLPGALAVRLWDLFGARIERTQVGIVGWSLLVSAIEYSALVVCGGNITQLFAKHGALKLDILLSRRILIPYLMLLGANAVLSAFLSHKFHSDAWQQKIAAALGRSFIESPWTELTRNAVNRWVILTLRSGWQFRGWLSYTSERPENGMVRLSQAHAATTAPAGWDLARPPTTCLFHAADIESIMIHEPDATTTPDPADNPAPADSQGRRISWNNSADLAAPAPAAPAVPAEALTEPSADMGED